MYVSVESRGSKFINTISTNPIHSNVLIPDMTDVFEFMMIDVLTCDMIAI